MTKHLAQIINRPLLDSVGNINRLGSGAKILELFLKNFISLAVGLAGITAFFMLLWGGYEYITAAGDKEGIQKAVKHITSALIGLVLVFSIFAIIYVVEAVFGIPLLKINVPTIE